MAARAPAVPPLVVITDRAQGASAGHSLVDVVRAAADAGAGWVLLREKDLASPERRSLARQLVAALEGTGAGLVVAGDVELAAEVGAAGLHLAAADPRPAPPPGWRGTVGRSCHGVDELRSARREGAAYATLSPVFATASKPGYGPALGVEGLAAGCAAVPGLPVLALGGVTPGRAAACRQAGAAGVAVMGEVMRAADPAAVVRHLLDELRPAAGCGEEAAANTSPAARGSRTP